MTKVLILLGTFLLTTALLSAFYIPGQVKKTPLDVNSITRLAGEAQIADGSGGTTYSPVRATSTTFADSELSTSDVVLFHNSSCLLMDPDGAAPDCVSADDPEGRLLSAGTDLFATDRRTAEAVSDFRNLPADAEAKTGLVNKFPFGVEQRTYPFWDGYISQAVDAVYEDVEDIDGLETYRFLIDVPSTPFEVTAGVEGTYTTQKFMWIDPVTGSIVDQQEHQVRRLSNGDIFLDLDFRFTGETVAANVNAAKDNGSRLNLITSKVPIIGGILGVLALIGGVVLARGLESTEAARDRSLSPARERTVTTYEDQTAQFFEEAQPPQGETRASRREAE